MTEVAAKTELRREPVCVRLGLKIPVTVMWYPEWMSVEIAANQYHPPVHVDPTVAYCGARRKS